MKRLALSIATAAIIAFSTQGSAQVLATYNPTGAANNQATLAATNVATGVTAGAMTAKATYFSTNYYYSNSFGLASSGSVSSLAAAVTANYFTFTVTPASGQTLNVSGVDLSGDFGRQYYSGGNATYYLEASVGNGFGSGSGNILATWNVTNVVAAGPGIISLSTNSAFQGVTTAVEFRIYVVESQAYWADVIGAGATGANNSINIDGTVAAAGGGGGGGSGSGIATYNATGTSSSQTSLAATSVASGMTAGAMTTKATYISSGSNSFGLSNSASVSTLALAVSTPNYLTFTVTPNSGNTVTITGVDLSGDFSRQYYSGGNATYYLEASVGGGFGSGSGNILAQWNVTNTAAAGPGVINLSTNSAFQNVAGQVEFRIYIVESQAYWADNIGGGGNTANNSIVVDGSVSSGSSSTFPPNTIASFNAKGIAQSSNPTSLAATNVAGNMSATAMTVPYGNYKNSVAANTFGFANNGAALTSLASAVSAGSYFTFTVTPSSNYQLNIAGVDLSSNFYSQGGATYYLEASVGSGFGSGSGNILATWTPGKPSTGPSAIINLAGNTAFQGVAGPVVFRIYVAEPVASDQDEIGGGASSADNSVNVTGTVVSTIVNTSGIATLGVNLTGDWLFADSAKQANPAWYAPNSTSTTVPVNSQGWPTQDCAMLAWQGVPNNDGTYLLSFTGKATIAFGAGSTSYGTITSTPGANGTPTTTGTYDGTNTTAYVNITDTSSENLLLNFTNTVGGISNVHLWRPTAEGAKTTLGTVNSSSPGGSSGTQMFGNETLAMSKLFSVTRFMDLMDVNNNNTVTSWSQRTLPSANQNNAYGNGAYANGIAYEYAVAYCNATNTDLYISIPMYANSNNDQTYYTNLAYLIKYGSDGTNTPITKPTSNLPYAGLNAGLHVYLEYGNEMWNTGFYQFGWNYAIVKADHDANSGAGNAEWAILNYDGLAEGSDGTFYTGGFRRVAYQDMLISNSFRKVFTDAAMPCDQNNVPNLNPTVRPLLEFQGSNGQGSGATELEFINNNYDNADGYVPAHQTTPHPVNYFFWGGGGATYYNANTENVGTADAIFASGVPQTGTYAYSTSVQTDAALAKAYGLKQVAYEGGWQVGTTYADPNHSFDNRANQGPALAKIDTRATQIEVNANQTFQLAGGNLNIYYTSSNWDPLYIWSLTSQINNLNTPLINAIGQIGTTAPATANYGNQILGTTTLSVNSKIYSVNADGYSIPAYIWLPLITTTGNYQISVQANDTNNPPPQQLVVFVDGHQLGSVINVPNSNSPTTFVVGMVNLSAGQHGLMVRGTYSSYNNYSDTNFYFEHINMNVVVTPQ